MSTRKSRAATEDSPAHLPREEIVIGGEGKRCPCWGGALHVVGEGRSQRLDKMPAKLRAIVTRRPKTGYLWGYARDDRS